MRVGSKSLPILWSSADAPFARNTNDPKSVLPRYLCADHYADELEPLLETIMLEDFNVQAEDGSPLQACRLNSPMQSSSSLCRSRLHHPGNVHIQSIH